MKLSLLNLFPNKTCPNCQKQTLVELTKIFKDSRDFKCTSCGITVQAKDDGWRIRITLE